MPSRLLSQLVAATLLFVPIVSGADNDSAASLSNQKETISASPTQLDEKLGAQFRHAYLLLREADKIAKADKPKALANYAAALKELEDIQKADREWNPTIVAFRIKYCRHMIIASGAQVEPSAMEPTASSSDSNSTTSPKSPTEKKEGTKAPPLVPAASSSAIQ